MSVLKTTGSYDYNAICDICGFKFKASMLKKRWDGLMVCKHDFEMRHPMDFYTTRNDVHLLPWTRPDSVGSSVSPQDDLVNWALLTNGGTITASSQLAGFPGFPPDNLNDGITYSDIAAWVDDQVNVFPKWVKVDLSAPKQISKVVVIGPQDVTPSVDPFTNSVSGSLYSIKDFTISAKEVSTGNYVQVAQVLGNNNVVKEVLFAPINTQSILITIYSTQRTDGRASLIEVQTYGAP